MTACPKDRKNHTTPCASCPFLRAKAGMLRPARAREIAANLRRDNHFWCHKTVDYSDEGEGCASATRGSLICAGSMIVTERGGDRPSQYARVSMRVNLLDWSAIERAAADPSIPCFDSLDDFIKGHTKAARRSA